MPRFPFGKKREERAKQGAEADAQEKEKSGIAYRFARFFQTEPQKEKVLRREDLDGAGDTYYATVSAGYKVAQRIFCVILVAFLLISIVTNYREITYGNLFYFVRDFGNAVDLASSGNETLSYDVYPNQNFSLYRGGIAAVSPTNVHIFTATGRRTLKSEAAFSTPITVCSDRYVLVYDLGGTTFSMYNSFSKVYTESLADQSETLTDAAQSDSGVFAVGSRSHAYKSVIRVYNKSMKPIGKYSKDLYASDIALNAEGTRMAVLYYDVGDGQGRTTVRMFDISPESRVDDEDRLLWENAYHGQFPMQCAFLNEESLAVISDCALYVLGMDGDEIRSATYASGSVCAMHAGEQGAAVAVRAGALQDRTRLIAFDKNGKMLYNDVIASNVKFLDMAEQYVFLRSESGVLRLDTISGEEQFEECQSGTMLVYDAKTVIVCAASKAVYLKF